MNRLGISVVVPAKDEEENILPLHSEISSVLRRLETDYEIILVDDGSRDSTAEKMVAARKKDARVKVVLLRRGFGQSAAMQAGFGLASKGLVCYIDADMQADFSQLPLLLEKIENGADAVVGWRHRRADPFLKGFFSGIAGAMGGMLLDLQVHDPGCPFKLMRAGAAKELRLYGEMHRYIIPILSWRGYRIEEVKISHRPRLHGRPKYGWKRLYKGFVDLVMVWLWQKYAFRPMHIFGGAGLAAIGLGAATALLLLALRLDHRVSLVNSSLPLLAAVLFIAGIMLFCFGIIADAVARSGLEARGEKSYSVKKIYR